MRTPTAAFFLLAGAAACSSSSTTTTSNDSSCTSPGVLQVAALTLQPDAGADCPAVAASDLMEVGSGGACTPTFDSTNCSASFDCAVTMGTTVMTTVTFAGTFTSTDHGKTFTGSFTELGCTYEATIAPGM